MSGYFDRAMDFYGTFISRATRAFPLLLNCRITFKSTGGAVFDIDLENLQVHCFLEYFFNRLDILRDDILRSGTDEDRTRIKNPY